jgi:predicted dehydrogenase
LLREEPLTEPVGYVDLAEENLRWAQEWCGAARSICFDSLALALRALTPDLVVLATPPMQRARDALAAFESGAHLLSEKPLTLDFDEGVRIARAAEAAGRAFAVGLNFRYQHSVLRARDILRSGEIGAPSFARFVYWRNRDGRRPGLNRFPLTMRQPMLYEQTIHHIDEIRFVYDAEVERVWCRCHNPPWSMYQDDSTVAAVLEMARGLLVHYSGTWSAQTKMDEFLWRTDCDQGALFQRAMFSDLRIARGRDAETVETIPLPAQEPLVDDARLLLTDVARQVLAGNLRPHPSGIDHLKTFGVIAACEESHLTGRRIEMREFLECHAVPQQWL